MVSDLDQRALRAAGAVGVAHGLADDSAAVIYSGSNVLVHLRPAPVVARVMTGTVALHDDPQRWLTRESSVLEFLAPTGLAVRPSALITPGPHCQDGLWMTFVEWIPDVDSAVDVKDAGQLGRTLRDLHETLAPFTGDLGTLADLGEDIQRLHGKLQPADETQGEAIASLAARLSTLRKDVFASTLPVQALHGDVSLRMSTITGTPQL